LIIGFQNTVENVGDVFWDTVYYTPTQRKRLSSTVWSAAGAAARYSNTAPKWK